MARWRTVLAVGLVIILAAVAGRAVPRSAAADDGAAGGAEFKMLATLFGSPAITGKVTYRERPRDGVMERRFRVVIDNGTPGQFLVVAVGNYVAGVMQLDALGKGEFTMLTPVFIEDPQDAAPMPINFPIVIDEDVATVGPLSGIFFDREFTRPGNEHLVSSKYRLHADLFSGVATIGSAVYRERIKQGALERRFLVLIQNATPNSTFDVGVNGLVVGQITTNVFGAGKFELRTAEFIDHPDEGQPMPDAFPSLVAGDFVQAGPVSGTLLVD